MFEKILLFFETNHLLVSVISVVSFGSFPEFNKLIFHALLWTKDTQKNYRFIQVKENKFSNYEIRCHSSVVPMSHFSCILVASENRKLLYFFKSKVLSYSLISIILINVSSRRRLRTFPWFAIELPHLELFSLSPSPWNRGLSNY